MPVCDSPVRSPEACSVFVAGKVNRPGAYPLEYGVETSVLRVLALARAELASGQ